MGNPRKGRQMLLTLLAVFGVIQAVSKAVKASICNIIKGGNLLCRIGGPHLLCMGAAYVIIAVYDTLKEEEEGKVRPYIPRCQRMANKYKWLGAIQKGFKYVEKSLTTYIHNLQVKRPKQRRCGTQRRTTTTVRRKRRKRFRKHKRDLLMACMALQSPSVHGYDEGGILQCYESIARFDTDSIQIGVDNRCSATMSHDISDFIGPLEPTNRTIKGFGGVQHNKEIM